MEESFFDSFLAILILFAIVLAISYIVRKRIKSNFEKNRKRESHYKLTGKQVANIILENNWINDVEVLKSKEDLPDYYDPKNKQINLRESNYDCTSISAISIAAHEVGHALQFKEDHILMRLAIFIFPAANFGATMSWLFLIAGLIFPGFEQMFLIGLFLLGLAFFYQIINIPIEINASRRALNLLIENSLIIEDEKQYVKEVLTAASHTYAAAPASVISEFINSIKRRS